MDMTTDTEHWLPVYSKFINIESIECPNCTNFHTVLPTPLNNTHAKCEEAKMNISLDM